ncbi:uncharacterized protein LOC109852957 isoform X2 [Pseudomyrmex gracilis]|uniref:uncharacterized protein LOC109852957 isoform X2 n=1 Tax=Pseudomyrmex gracilis TaxID=219809 RepID=UPI00099569F8|nr:uncharacterized protein LOC109852957 isoform X2 [Pseudomyrmex gracilis]
MPFSVFDKCICLKRERTRNGGAKDDVAESKYSTNGTAPVQNAVQTDHPTTDSDNASIGSGNSNLSTGALQNIRDKMAASLERIKELEEQVKAIAMLQVQVSVLKEEKRNLVRQVDELSKINSTNDLLNGSLFPEARSAVMRKLSYSSESTVSSKDIGTMCGHVMTRDVGISHQPVRTRDVGLLVTSTPIKPNKSLQISKTLIEEILPNESILSNGDDMYIPKLEKNDETFSLKTLQEIGTNTDGTFNSSCLHFTKEVKKSSCSTETELSMKDILTKDEVSTLIEEAIKTYKKRSYGSPRTTLSRGVQCILKSPVEKREQAIQVTEQFKMRSHVSVTAKPITTEVGTEVRIGPSTRSVCVGPDLIDVQSPVSLNLMNSRNHSSKYNDAKTKTKSRSVGLMVDDLLKTTSRGIDTSELTPKYKDASTSTIKKKFVDVSVGDSVRPHISISCAANYCDNCKETIKSLAKQMTNSTENILNHQNSNSVSRIPRPSHIPLNINDHRRLLKRQDTYTKNLVTGVIRYDTDNKEQYDSSNRLKEINIQQSEKSKDDKNATFTIHSAEKEADNEEKSELPESALFQPIQDKPRKKVEPSKEMQAAMKVLNDSLKKSPSRNISHQLKNATNIIQLEWFKISSTSSANPLDVEDYLDCFEECSGTLLEYIVNMTDSSGNTAMHYAVSHGNFDVVSILLDSKVCDINKTNSAGYTVVMLAALADFRNSTHISVANRLFQMADVNIRAKAHGQTALMLAASHGRKDITQLLLDAGAAVNIQDKDGSTALMCAAEHNHIDVVRQLLAHPDCDPSIVDEDGCSALKIALEAGNRDIGVLLYAHEHVNRGISPYSTLRRSRRGSKPTTPTGPSPSAPASPAPSRRIHSSNPSFATSKYPK